MRKHCADWLAKRNWEMEGMLLGLMVKYAAERVADARAVALVDAVKACDSVKNPWALDNPSESAFQAGISGCQAAIKRLSAP